MRPEGMTFTALGGAGDCAVNGQAVVVHDLQDEDRLSLGEAELVFHQSTRVTAPPRWAVHALRIAGLVAVAVILGVVQG